MTVDKRGALVRGDSWLVSRERERGLTHRRYMAIAGWSAERERGRGLTHRRYGVVG